MTITITITDPHTEDSQTLLRLSKLLLQIAMPQEVKFDIPRAGVLAEFNKGDDKTMPSPPLAPSIEPEDDYEIEEELIPTPPEIVEVIDAQVDITGLPWDERIHSREKTIKKDGKWRDKRNVNPEVIKKIEKELRGKIITHRKPIDTSLKSEKVSGGQTPIPPPPVISQSEQFEECIEWVMDEISAKRLTREQIHGVVQSIGLANIRELKDRPDLIPTVLSSLKEVAAL